MRKILSFFMILILCSIFIGCSPKAEAPSFQAPTPKPISTPTPFPSPIPSPSATPSPAQIDKESGESPDDTGTFIVLTDENGEKTYTGGGLNIGCPIECGAPYLYHLYPSDHYLANISELKGIDAEIAQEISTRYFHHEGYVLADDTDSLLYHVGDGLNPLHCIIGLREKNVVVGAFTTPSNVIYTDELGAHVFYVERNNPKLLNTINTAIAELQQDGTIDRILKQYNT